MIGPGIIEIWAIKVGTPTVGHPVVINLKGNPVGCAETQQRAQLEKCQCSNLVSMVFFRPGFSGVRHQCPRLKPLTWYTDWGRNYCNDFIVIILQRHLILIQSPSDNMALLVIGKSAIQTYCHVNRRMSSMKVHLGIPKTVILSVFSMYYLVSYYPISTVSVFLPDKGDTNILVPWNIHPILTWSPEK